MKNPKQLFLPKNSHLKNQAHTHMYRTSTYMVMEVCYFRVTASARGPVDPLPAPVMGYISL